MRCALLVSFLLWTPLSVGAAEVIAPEDTQAGMRGAASVRLRAAEQEVQSLLASLVAKAGSRADAVGKLEAAQAAWKAYRDAQIAAAWPAADASAYGSAHPMCVADAGATLTAARARELRAMLEPVEGDVCSAGWPE